MRRQHCPQCLRLNVIIKTCIKVVNVHFRHCYPASGNGRKEGYVLFNGALDTFYLWLYGVIHMVKDHSDSERGNPLPPHGLLFWARLLDSIIAAKCVCMFVCVCVCVCVYGHVRLCVWLFQSKINRVCNKYQFDPNIIQISS